MQIVTMTKTTDICTPGGCSESQPAARRQEVGMGRVPNTEQETQIQRTLIDRQPEPLMMIYSLGSHVAVALLIAQQLGTRLLAAREAA
ncbi:MAG: hypothetical protein AB7T01_07845 [Acidithiobacillus sp.]